MRTYGNVIQEIRESKNLTQAEVAEGIITPQFLSHFENNKSDIKLETFLLLLDRLNVKYSEFIVDTKDSNSSTQSDFLQQLLLAKQTKNKILLKELVKKENKLFVETNNYRHQHNVLIAQQTLRLTTDCDYAEADTQVIVDYLFKVDNWGYYEMALFGNSIFFLENKHLISFQNIIFSKIKKYGSSLKQKGEFAKIILNMINFNLIHNQLDAAFKLLSELETLLTGTQHFYQENQLNYLKGIYYIKNGETDKGKDLCMKAIEILTHFKQYANANHKQEELEALLAEVGLSSKN